MEYLEYLRPCPRALYFGALMGGFVGGAAAAADAMTAAMKLKPRPEGREISRAMSAAGLRAGAAGGLFFGLYQTAKCGLLSSRRRHGLDEWRVAGVSAAVAAVPTALLTRPSWGVVLLLVALDNAAMILPSRGGD